MEDLRRLKVLRHKRVRPRSQGEDYACGKSPSVLQQHHIGGSLFVQTPRYQRNVCKYAIRL